MTAVLMLLTMGMTMAVLGTLAMRRRGQLRAWQHELDVAFAVHERDVDLRRHQL